MKGLYLSVAVVCLLATSSVGYATQPKPTPSNRVTSENTNANANLNQNGNTNQNTNANYNNSSASGAAKSDSNSEADAGASASISNRYGVNTAYAAPLTTSNGTCMGSSSGGVQGMSLGVSVGTTWTDKNCDRRYNSIRLQQLGNSKAAVAILCQDEDVRAAMDDAGTPCPPSKKKFAEAEAAVKPQRFDPPVGQ